MAYSLDPVLGSIGWGVALNTALDDLDSRIVPDVSNFVSYQASATLNSSGGFITGWDLTDAGSFPAVSYVTLASDIFTIVPDDGLYAVSLGVAPTAAGGEVVSGQEITVRLTDNLTVPLALEVDICPGVFSGSPVHWREKTWYMPTGTTIQLVGVCRGGTPGVTVTLDFVKVR